MTWNPGDLATWVHVLRGGYGYTIPVDAVVVRVAAKRVLVRVQKRSGEEVERWVTPGALRRRAAR